MTCADLAVIRARIMDDPGFADIGVDGQTLLGDDYIDKEVVVATVIHATTSASVFRGIDITSMHTHPICKHSAFACSATADQVEEGLNGQSPSSSTQKNRTEPCRLKQQLTALQLLSDG